ncbi:NfeD family protein [Flintibacter muris]|uniref:NfeD family protein n=1 Tax=Flintibacter muris TaxID=2941327 RepID=UPI002041F91F|nr:NfeD family protein [Flintibacter muris]
MRIFWLAAFIAFAIGEAITVGLVSVWFAVGALAGLFAAALGAGLWLQITVFLGVSALALALFKPLSGKFLRPKLSATNADRVIGASALVTETIDNSQAQGQVKVKGQVWSARSDQDVVIPAGRNVRVLRIEGVKVIVELL